MFIKIFHINNVINNYIVILGSKSISNRILFLNKLFINKIIIKNLSNSEDTILIKKNNNILLNKLINVKNSGITIRFLTSYYSLINKKFVILFGKKRMNKRPINILVKTLKKMGAIILFLKKKWFPPIKILKSKLINKNIKINSNISSQYISSLLIISSKIKNKINFFLKKKIISFPYIKMTYLIMKYLNIKINIYERLINIFFKKNIKKKIYYIESDWSSISYYYSLSVILNNINLKLNYFYKNSIQGDNIIFIIYKKLFNIKTYFFKKKYINIFNIKNYNYIYNININNVFLYLINYPDIAQTIIITLSILKKKYYICGLQTLIIKESNRLISLKKELKKIGVFIKIGGNFVNLINYIKINLFKKIKINSYNDHRMVMCFIPIVLVYKNIYINNILSVKKSYPSFWKDLKKNDFVICLK